MKTSAERRPLRVLPVVGLLVLLAAASACRSRSEPAEETQPGDAPSALPAPLTPQAKEAMETRQRAEAEGEAFREDLRRFGTDGIEAGIAALDDARIRNDLRLQRLATVAGDIETYAPNVRVEIERQKMYGRLCKDEIARLEKIGGKAVMPDIERTTRSCRAYGGRLGQFEDELRDFAQRHHIDIGDSLDR